MTTVFANYVFQAHISSAAHCSQSALIIPPPSPCLLAPLFNSVRPYGQLVYYLNLKLGEEKLNNRGFICYKSSVALLRADRVWKLAWRIRATSSTFCVRLMGYLPFIQNPFIYFLLTLSPPQDRVGRRGCACSCLLISYQKLLCIYYEIRQFNRLLQKYKTSNPRKLKSIIPQMSQISGISSSDWSPELRGT